MKGWHHLDAVPFAPLASRSGNRFSCSEQALEGRRTERDDHLRANEGELAQQKRLTGVRFVALRSTISGWPALDDVCDINVFAFQTNRHDDLVEQLTRTPYEGTAAGVFVGARTFTDEHQLRVRVALSEYNRFAMFVKFASPAITNVFSNRLKGGIKGLYDGKSLAAAPQAALLAARNAVAKQSDLCCVRRALRGRFFISDRRNGLHGLCYGELTSGVESRGN